ncbi:MAG: oxygen-dependent coproporphyrinogen oxidase [Rhodospirillales bacterium]
MSDLPFEQRTLAAAWFQELRDRLVAAFEAIEADGPGAGPPGRFEARPWERPGGGGGTMSLVRGRVLEKAGVNISVVDGLLSPEMRARIPGAADDGRFWASGVSVVVHPLSPHVPAAHMNTRMIATTRTWFGGGADLTPVFADADDTRAFHGALAAACDRFDTDWYPRFKQWCDEYFFLPHRGEARGEGGIFFDDLATGDWARDFAFVRAVGEAFLDVYPRIIRRHKDKAWTVAERHAQLVKRGRYVEFNLLYDRGTQFGLKTGGNPDAILMSLPPAVAWP